MGALPWLAWHRLNFFLKWQHTLLGWLDEVVTSTMSFNKHLMFLFPPSQGRALEVLSLGPCAPAGVWCGPFLSSTPRVRQLGTGTAVRSPVWTSGFFHLLRLPLGMGRAGGGEGPEFESAMPRQGLDLPALGRLWMCVCASFLFASWSYASNYGFMPWRHSQMTGLTPKGNRLLLWRITSMF